MYAAETAGKAEIMGDRRYPSNREAAETIVEVGRRLYEKGFVAANDGNISVLTADGCILATPSGVSKGFMTEAMLVKLDLEGKVVSGKLKPSSEIKMHLRLYRELPEIGAVVHAHPPKATTLAAAGIPIDRAYIQEAVVLLGVVPVVPFALPGSEALAESVAPYCRDYNALLLEHHGAVTWGPDAIHALYRMESVEYNAGIYMNMRALGIDRPLSEVQIDELLALRPSWGVTAGGRPKGRE